MPAREPWLGQTRHSWPASSFLPRESLIQILTPLLAAHPVIGCGWCSCVCLPASVTLARRGTWTSDDDPLSRHLLHSSGQRERVDKGHDLGQSRRKAPELLSLRLRTKLISYVPEGIWKTRSWGPDWLIPGDGDNIKTCAFIWYFTMFYKTTEHCETHWIT